MIKYITYFLLMLFIIVGIFAINSGVDKQVLENKLNQTLTESYQNISTILMNQELGDYNKWETMLVNIIMRVADLGVYIYIQIALITTKLAIENPWINFKLLLWLLIFVIIMMILLPLIKFLGICYVLIYDIIKNRKHKKEMIKLKHQKLIKNDIERIKKLNFPEEESF